MSKKIIPSVEGPHPYTVYDLGPGGKPGRILRTGSVSNVMTYPHLCGIGEGYIPVLGDDQTQMVDVDTKQLVDKPNLLIPDTITIQEGSKHKFQLPPGTKFHKVGGSPDWDLKSEKDPELEVLESGSFRLDIRPPWPYKERTIQVIVTPKDVKENAKNGSV